MSSRPLALAFSAALLSGGDCGPGPEPVERCGPTHATVVRVVDGDTVELAGGEKVRYLMVDTPEITRGHDDCYGQEAAVYNASLVLDQEVELSYDEECEDRFDRLLAYVNIRGREVNRLLVERGYACVLYIPPNGEARYREFQELEATARAEARGVWGACEEVTCD